MWINTKPFEFPSEITIAYEKVKSKREYLNFLNQLDVNVRDFYFPKDGLSEAQITDMLYSNHADSIKKLNITDKEFRNVVYSLLERMLRRGDLGLEGLAFGESYWDKKTQKYVARYVKVPKTESKQPISWEFLSLKTPLNN